MTYFKVPGPLGLNVPGPRTFGRELFVNNGKHQAPSHGSNGHSRFSMPSLSSGVHSANKKAIPSSAVEAMDGNDYLEICYDVHSEEFGKLAMGLRDEAVSHTQNRKAELLRWDQGAKSRTLKWFNSSNDEIRDYLLPRLDSVIRVLRLLKPENFDYDTQENRVNSGCFPGDGLVLDTAASVCPPDVGQHRILINLRFYTYPRLGTVFGTRDFNGKDSQLMTLIHEVTHFNDVASSTDDFYGAYNALGHANHQKIRMNADSLAAYILGMAIDSPPMGR